MTLNSIDWNDEILYIEQNIAKHKPIGELIDTLLYNNSNKITHIKKNRTEYLELDNGFYIPSTDENGYCNWYKIEAVTRHLPVGDLVKVITESGREVTATQSKSFLVWNGEKFKHTLGSEIKIGDILPTTTKLNRKKEMITNYVNLQDTLTSDKYLYSEDIIKTYNELLLIKKQNNKNIPLIDFSFLQNKDDKYVDKIKPNHIYTNPNNLNLCLPKLIELDEQFGILIGSFLANGLCTKHFVVITNDNSKIQEKISIFCAKYSINYTLSCSSTQKFKKGINDIFQIYSELLSNFLNIVCYNYENEKILPYFSYTAPNNFIKGLISSYYSTKCFIFSMSETIFIKSKSQQLIKGITFLLTYFGIHSFMDNIEIYINNFEKSKIYNLGIKNIYLLNFYNLFDILDKNKKLQLKEICDNKRFLSDNFKQTKDVYFDKIKSIKYVKGTNQYVYDLTVETTRNFQLFNGLNCADTFHKAGMSEKAMTAGVPRFQELLNATQNPRNVNCKIYFKHGNSSLRELRETVGHSLVGLTIADVSLSMTVCLNKTEEKWYKAYSILYSNNFTKYNNCVSIKIDMEKLYNYKLTLQNIADYINNEIDDIFCVVSPPKIGQLDIFVDTKTISIDKPLLFINNENKEQIYIEECVIPYLEKEYICGIQGITQIYYIQEDDEWIVETDGSNFKKLLAHPIVDSNRVISNNVWDIYYTLGIEAARQFLIEEFTSIMEGINNCHTQLLVDRMTHSGTISSISRYTLRKDETGPIGKASFEETMDNFLEASSNGSIEPTKGVSASIICGKRANIGTGIIDLQIDIEQLPNSNTILENKVFEK